MSNKIQRLKSVIGTVGLSRSTIYALMAENKFPQSISLGERSVGWTEESIQSWLDSRISASKVAN